MCTAISFKTNSHYFGRNLDLDYSYNESVTITPRNFPLAFRNVPALLNHYALIGIATIVEDYPLYYDATNEHGLSMAGLNFPGNAVYHTNISDTDNVAPFELIPWILGQCETVDEAEKLLSKVNLLNVNFSTEYPLTPLHWIIADQQRCIAVEPLREGLRIFENPVGVLTNNPPFPFHMLNLTNYLNLTREIPQNRFAKKIDLQPYSLGMGAYGLPGDLSSASRFVRAAFTKMNSACDTSENASISQFFHILDTVVQTNGCNRADRDFEKTIYTSCCNTDHCIYYYTTYANRQITAVDMRKTDLNSRKLHSFKLITEQQIRVMDQPS